MAADLTYSHAMWFALRVVHDRRVIDFLLKGTPFGVCLSPCILRVNVGSVRATRRSMDDNRARKVTSDRLQAQLVCAVVLAWDLRCVHFLL